MPLIGLNPLAIARPRATTGGALSGNGGVPPGAISGLTVVAGSTTADLSWTAPATGGPVTSYSVSSSPATTVQTTAGTSLTFTGLTDGTTYTFIVTAIGPGGSTASSPSSSVTPRLLNLLIGGPTTAQIAAGSLTAATGQTVSCSRTRAAFARTSSGTLTLIPANQVRVESQGILVEPAAVTGFSNSLITSWNDFSTTHTANNQTAPDGTSTAGTMTMTAGSAQHCMYSIGAAGQTGPGKCLSAYVKAGTYSIVALGIDQGTTSGAVFDLGNNAAVLTSKNVTSTGSEALANGWFRVWVVPGAGAGQETVIAFGPDATVAGAYTVTNYTTNGSTGIVWHAQTEATAYPTSLITNSGVTNSRDADVVTVTNPLAALSQPVNTWRAGVKATPMTTWANMPEAQENTFLAAGDFTTNSWLFYQNGAGTVDLLVIDNASGQKDGIGSSGLSGSAATTCEATDASGTLAVTPGTPSTLGAGTGVVSTQATPVYIGVTGALAAQYFCGWLSDIYIDNH